MYIHYSVYDKLIEMKEKVVQSDCMCPSPPTTNIREFLSTAPPNYRCLLPSAGDQDQGWPTYVGPNDIINQITRIQFDREMKVDRI